MLDEVLNDDPAAMPADEYWARAAKREAENPPCHEWPDEVIQEGMVDHDR